MLKRLQVLLLVLLMTGCAGVNKQAFNRDAAKGIQKVVVTERLDEERYEAFLMAHPGTSFGLIGGLIAAADMNAKTDRLNAAVKPSDTKLQRRAAEKLAQALGNTGYQSSVVSVPKGLDDPAVISFAQKNAPADAVVTLTMSARYVAAGPASPYMPYVVIRVTANDMASNKLLYEDTHSYGYTFPHSQTVHLAGGEKYRFNDMDAIEANPLGARQGLQDGVDALVAQIANDLKRN